MAKKSSGVRVWQFVLTALLLAVPALLLFGIFTGVFTIPASDRIVPTVQSIAQSDESPEPTAATADEIPSPVGTAEVLFVPTSEPTESPPDPAAITATEVALQEQYARDWAATVEAISTAQALATPTCVSGWTTIDSPQLPTPDNDAQPEGILYAVAVVSPDDVWSVGNGSSPFLTATQTLIEHWNGSQWQFVPAAEKRSGESPDGYVLNGLAVIAADDIWSVGGYNSRDINRTVLEHWDGSRWELSMREFKGYLSGAVALSGNDVWAVGSSNEASTRPLILHFDGNDWSRVPFTIPGEQGGSLGEIVAVSASDIWAVGMQSISDVQSEPLAVHWNGAAWEVVRSPTFNDKSVDSPYALKESAGFNDVAALSANDIWAVGSIRLEGQEGRIGGASGFVEHWDGTSWSQVDRSGTGGFGPLFSVVTVSENDVWVSGGGSGYLYHALDMQGWSEMDHWNGVEWNTIPQMAVRGHAMAVVRLDSGGHGIWAVGSTVSGGLYSPPPVPAIMYRERLTNVSYTNDCVR